MEHKHKYDAQGKQLLLLHNTQEEKNIYRMPM